MFSELVAQMLALKHEAVGEYACNPRPTDVPEHLKTLDQLLAIPSLTPAQREAVAACRRKVEALRRGPEGGQASLCRAHKPQEQARPLVAAPSSRPAPWRLPRHHRARRADADEAPGRLPFIR